MIVRTTWCFRLPGPHARYLKLRYSDDTIEAVRLFLHREEVAASNYGAEVKIVGGLTERLHIKLGPADTARLEALQLLRRAKTWVEALRADIEDDALKSGVVLERLTKGMF